MGPCGNQVTKVKWDTAQPARRERGHSSFVNLMGSYYLGPNLVPSGAFSNLKVGWTPPVSHSPQSVVTHPPHFFSPPPTPRHPRCSSGPFAPHSIITGASYPTSSVLKGPASCPVFLPAQQPAWPPASAKGQFLGSQLLLESRLCPGLQRLAWSHSRPCLQPPLIPNLPPPQSSPAAFPCSCLPRGVLPGLL